MKFSGKTIPKILFRGLRSTTAFVPYLTISTINVASVRSLISTSQLIINLRREIALWTHKLIVGVDKALLDRREDSERIKNLSTAISYKAEAKGKDRQYPKKNVLIAVQVQSINLPTIYPSVVPLNHPKKPFLDELAVSRSRWCALLRID